MSRRPLSFLGAVALLASVSTVSAAQKGHGGEGARMPSHAPAPHDARPPKADHESSMGAAHEGKKDDKGHMPDMKHEAKNEDHTERMAWRDAHDQSSRLLKGVKLTAAERQLVKEIDKKYETQLKALKKDEKSADKAGTDNDAAYAQKVAALATQERADIRAVLSASQQARFDANVAARAAAKH